MVNFFKSQASVLFAPSVNLDWFLEIKNKNKRQKTALPLSPHPVVTQSLIHRSAPSRVFWRRRVTLAALAAALGGSSGGGAASQAGALPCEQVRGG
jgi:hypothetical protein